MRNHGHRDQDSNYMIENIVIDKPKQGYTYKGLVDNFQSPHRRPGCYEVLLTTTNEIGDAVLINKWTVHRNESEDCPREFRFWFTWDENYRKIKCSD